MPLHLLAFVSAFPQRLASLTDHLSPAMIQNPTARPDTGSVDHRLSEKLLLVA